MTQHLSNVSRAAGFQKTILVKVIRKIGFHGGHTIFELGPASDVELFFSCLERYVEDSAPAQDWSLLTDRLYRRYLRQDELSPALALMRKAREIFSKFPAKTSIEWNVEMLKSQERTWLNPDQATLADVFSRYFEGFVDVCESAESFFEAFKTYQPVRVVISDLAGFARDKKKPLEEYDALERKPMWLR
ncbi:hypothetical protein ABLT15_10660 [Paraburkholderia tropica]|uniref:hypothetical protein n=1 Tax=Paraburkholderia tropica TaxID=92647 RepID=UPI0018222E79|nr:hypothetical protein [Paraburkholderia tropica]MBB2980292.1 hypothetical protein [Paraburkholderia tropica]